MKWRRRNSASLSVLIAFGIISITGILMYFLPHAVLTSTLHTIFGFLFITAAVFHLFNNWPSVKAYTTILPSSSVRKTISKEIIVVGLASTLVLLASFFQITPVQAIYDWGQELRTSQKKDIGKLEYEIVNHPLINSETKLTIDVRKGSFFDYPTYALWIEDTTGNYLQTLYITNNLAKGEFFNIIEKDGDPIHRERPEALPVWAHLFGSTSSLGNVVPDADSKVPDGYSGATILNNFLLITSSTRPLPQRFKIKFEINQSFDWNEYYSKDRFPDDQIYSGDGKVGQPSIVYEVMIDLYSIQKYFVMMPIGHGHHSGEDGIVYSDLSALTTALQIIDRIIVEVK